jgi:hypothetical protein
MVWLHSLNTPYVAASSQHSEVSMEGGAAVASNQTSSLKHMTRKLVTTWNSSTPLRSGANTRQPLDFNVLQLKHNAQPNQANIVK